MKRSRFKYDLPIKSAKHAAWCLREAERRYHGRVVKDSYGMTLVEDRIGLMHTDAVLRALSGLEWEEVRS